MVAVRRAETTTEQHWQMHASVRGAETTMGQY